MKIEGNYNWCHKDSIINSVSRLCEPCEQLIGIMRGEKVYG